MITDLKVNIKLNFLLKFGWEPNGRGLGVHNMARIELGSVAGLPYSITKLQSFKQECGCQCLCSTLSLLSHVHKGRGQQ